jgi:hypothetical protein
MLKNVLDGLAGDAVLGRARYFPRPGSASTRAGCQVVRLVHVVDRTAVVP